MKYFSAKQLPLVSIILTLTSISGAQAAAPFLDNGQALNKTKPYENVQVIPGVYESKAVYGKITPESSADIYKFRPDKDGEQIISFMVKETGVKSTAQPILILMDPTNATETEQLGLPTPGDAYHPAIIKALEGGSTYYDRSLFQRYVISAQQKIKLAKDTDYYLVAVEPYGQPASYVIKFGEGQAWTPNDVVNNIGAWFKVQTNTYGGQTPFKFPAGLVGISLLLLGLMVLVGTFLIEHTLSFLANRSKPAGYLLVKLQPISRIATWVALWFTLIGAYLHYDRISWVGLPFVQAILFIFLVINLLIYTFRLSPRIANLEVLKKEATIPTMLRRKMILSFVISFVLLTAIIILLAMQFLN